MRKQLLLVAAFGLFTLSIIGSIRAYLTPNILTTVTLNGSAYFCGTAIPTGACAAVAANTQAYNASSNFTGMYNVQFEIGWSSGGGTPNSGDFMTVTDNSTTPKITDSSNNVQTVVSYKILNSTISGNNVTFLATVPTSTTNFTILFKRFSSNQGSSNIVWNVTLNLTDINNRYFAEPTPDRYCANDFNLTWRSDDWNGTNYVPNWHYQTCQAGVYCSNNSFFGGPACDPPPSQQSIYYLGTIAIFIIIFAAFTWTLKKVIG